MAFRTLAIEIRCRLCNQPYVPTHDDIRSGPEVYRRCPPCREARREAALAASLAAVEEKLAELGGEGEGGAET